MKGVILAGGYGTRLMPCTKVTNKHLLPVYNEPMIFHPLRTLINAGIKDIMIITGPEHAGSFINLLGSGKEFGANFTYKVQDEAMGIAHAIALAEDFIKNEKFVVILGDNIFEEDISDYVREFQNSEKEAMILLKEKEDAHRFGVAEVKGDRVISTEEKPKKPKSKLAITGLYMLNGRAFEIIKTLKPSHRNELEITDVINHYIKSGTLGFKILNGFWSDAGTFESLHKSSQFIKERRYNGRNLSNNS